MSFPEIIPQELVPRQGSYIRTFKMQTTGADGNTVRISVPRDIVEREASKKGMSVKQFTQNFHIEWRFNSFDGAYMVFVPKEKTKDE